MYPLQTMAQEVCGFALRKTNKWCEWWKFERFKSHLIEIKNELELIIIVESGNVT